MLKEIEKECKYHGISVFIQEIDKKNNIERYRCKKCRSYRVAEKRKKNKLLLVQKFGGQCQICGYNKFVGALEFHHMDAKSKSFGIAAKGSICSYSKMQIEANKCILLCSNCHREIEHGGFKIPDVIIKEFNNRIMLEEEVRIEKHRCISCDKIINKKCNYCKVCFNLSRRKVERPSREEFEKMLWEIPTIQIAKKYGVSDKAISNWAKIYNIDKPPRGYWSRKKMGLVG